MKSSSLNNIDIELIKKAVELEEKYKYIDLEGRENTFSGFMIKQIKQIYKILIKILNGLQ